MTLQVHAELLDAPGDRTVSLAPIAMEPGIVEQLLSRDEIVDMDHCRSPCSNLDSSENARNRPCSLGPLLGNRLRPLMGKQLGRDFRFDSPIPTRSID